MRSHWRLLAHISHADEIEWQLGIKVCWSVEDLNYLDALKYINNHAFISAVEHLEGLVMQRLFELSNANLASTSVYFLNYKKRSFILKHTQVIRCRNTSPKPLWSALLPYAQPSKSTISWHLSRTLHGQSFSSARWHITVCLVTSTFLNSHTKTFCKSLGAYLPTVRLQTSTSKFFVHMRRSTASTLKSAGSMHGLHMKTKWWSQQQTKQQTPTLLWNYAVVMLNDAAWTISITFWPFTT